MAKPLMSITVNTDEVNRQLQEVFQRSQVNGARLLHEAADGVISVGEPRVPFRTGALRLSGKEIPPPEHLPNGVIRQRFGYTAPYAAIVHEDLQAHHPIGQAKYLEATLEIDGPKIVQAAMEDLLSRGGGH